MDAAVLGDRLPEGTQKPLLGPSMPVIWKRVSQHKMKPLIKPSRWGFPLSKQRGRLPFTPTGHFALYDVKKGEVVKSDQWRPPDFRALIKIAQTEQGRSEVSCVLEEHENLLMAKPMILFEETGPTHFAFANQVSVQTDDTTPDGSTPDELVRTIQSHLWLANLEISSGCSPAWSATLPIPRDPHPDGPLAMTWNQLGDVHKTIVTAHRDRDVSGMLKGVVSNMHLLAKFAREAGFLPYIGHAHYIYECYLKSQINSSRPPSVAVSALKVLPGLGCCEMLSQYPRSTFQGLCGVTRGGQQQFATQTLRVRLLGIDFGNSITASSRGGNSTSSRALSTHPSSLYTPPSIFTRSLEPTPPYLPPARAPQLASCRGEKGTGCPWDDPGRRDCRWDKPELSLGQTHFLS